MPRQDIWQKTCQAVKLSYNSKHLRLEVSTGDFSRLL